MRECETVLFYALQLSAVDMLSSGGLSFLLGWPSILTTGDDWPCSPPQFDLCHR